VDEEYVLAFDIGTTGVKSIVVSVETGEISASATYNYPVKSIDPYRVEQDPLEWWRGVVYTTHNILSKLGIETNKIIGIGVTGQTPNCLPVDKNGSPLRNAIIHMDTRSHTIIEELKRNIDELELMIETGTRLDPRVDYSRILWLKRYEPNIYRATYKFLQAKDFIVFKLTGEFTTDYSDATLGYGLLSIKEKRYSKKVLNLLNIDEEKLPVPVPSTHIVGELTQKAADILKLRPDIPVIAGAFDTAAAVLGCGALKPGSFLISLGGSISVVGISDANVPNKFRFIQIDPNLLGYAIDLQTGGICYDWIKDIVLQSKLGGSNEEAYDILEREAKKVEPGSQGLVFLPYLAGGPSTAFNSNIRGLFYGLSLYHTKAHFVRATLEGIAFELKTMIEHLEKAGLKAEKVYLAGGGSKNKLWNEIITNILGKKTYVPATARNAAAYGIALATMVSLKRYSDLFEVQKLVKIEQTYTPSPEVFKKYSSYYGIYKSLINLLVKMFEDINVPRVKMVGDKSD